MDIHGTIISFNGKIKPTKRNKQKNQVKLDGKTTKIEKFKVKKMKKKKVNKWVKGKTKTEYNSKARKTNVSGTRCV